METNKGLTSALLCPCTGWAQHYATPQRGPFSSKLRSSSSTHSPQTPNRPGHGLTQRYLMEMFYWSLIMQHWSFFFNYYITGGHGLDMLWMPDARTQNNTRYYYFTWIASQIKREVCPLLSQKSRLGCNLILLVTLYKKRVKCHNKWSSSLWWMLNACCRCLYHLTFFISIFFFF